VPKSEKWNERERERERDREREFLIPLIDAWRA
jgi:hypothetical protein